MSLLEDKIRKNRDLFEGAEPGEGHLERFQEKLDNLHKLPSNGKRWYSYRLIRVAAVIFALIGLSVIYYLINPVDNSNKLAANTLPKEVQEARMYYTKLADQKLQKINECAPSSSEASYIQKVVTEEITELDSSSIKLEEQLVNEKDNKKIINALLRNYKTKSDLLDNILNRLCHI